MKQKKNIYETELINFKNYNINIDKNENSYTFMNFYSKFRFYKEKTYNAINIDNLLFNYNSNTQYRITYQY